MKGLILKDLYTLKKQFLFVIFYCVVFTAYGIILKSSGAYITLITIFLGMLPVTSMSYDERFGWNRHAVLFPIKRSEIVKSKYYLGYLFIIPVSILTLPINIIVERQINSQILINSLVSIIFSASSAIIMISVLFPFIFKFGIEKGRVIIIVVAAIVGGLFGALFVYYMLSEVISFVIYIPPKVMAIIALIISVISNFVSILISIRIYEKKEF